LLHHTLLERVQKNLRLKDIVQLHELFFELPQDFAELVAEAFRKRIIVHLQNSLKCPNLPSKHSEAIFQFLESEKLFWTSDDYIKILDLFSQFTDIQMLYHFHKLLKTFQDEYDDLKEERETLFKICKKWYERLLDRLTTSSRIQQNTILLIFHHASLLHGRIGRHTVLWKKIIELAVHSIKQFPESLVFKAMPSVEKLPPEIVMHFRRIIEEMLTASTQHIDDQLIIRIRQIGALSDEQLVIPSSLSENLICHIIECLEINHPSYDTDLDTAPASFLLSLLSAANFWKMILRADGYVEKLNSLHYIKIVKRAISQLGLDIIKESIDIFLLQNICKYDDDFLFTYFESVSILDDENVEVQVTKKILESIKKQTREYLQTFEHLNAFYVRYCSVAKVIDEQDYISLLHGQKNMWESISLDQTRRPEIWEDHYEILDVAKKVYKYNKSQTFYNVFEKILQEIPNEINVQTLVQDIMPEVFESYVKDCSKFQNWEDLQLTFAAMFWKKVTNINAELEFMAEFIPKNQDQKYMMTLNYLSEILKITQKLHQLSTVLEMFNVPRSEQDWLSKALSDLEEQSIFLGQLSSVFDTISNYLDIIDENGWSLIKELSIAEDFIIFLRSIAEHDLKNLINGVDDHSDERLIQEDTVSSLIQVKQFLFPLLNAAPTLTLDTFLQELFKVIELNPTLATKVTLCNSNNMALQNMYSNISNRGEVTKEKIRNAVKIGTYKFEWKSTDKKCSVNLSYPITKTRIVTYNFNDLQDLRGRALLIAKPDITIRGSNDGNEEDKTKDIMDEFVRQVDIAQDIVNNIAAKLIETGHFGYREFQTSVKGSVNMIQLVEKLKAELRKWENLVNKAQENHYYLTFFPARHILEFYDFFTSRSPSNTKICQTLVKFVNPNAKLQTRDRVLTIAQIRKDSHLQILNDIGTKLQHIFEAPKTPRLLKTPIERVASDVVSRGKLFVAACNDKSRVPNIIMSLYANHGSLPEPWQILICTSSTTSEELSIFIKRLNKIRSMREKEPNYFLALICYSEGGMQHHILDQFSQDVHPTNGLSSSAMSTIYQKLCSNVTCVSSDLSGQGKTEWIRRQCFENNKLPKSILISDGADFGKLVRQLKEFTLRPIECVHINIISSDYPGDVNLFLFELLSFGIVSNNADIASLPRTFIYIEIASSFQQHLLRSLPMMDYLPKHHITWNITNLIISRDINSPMQIVCRYLFALYMRQIDTKNISFIDTSTKNDEICDALCRELINRYFFKDNNSEEILSFRFLEIFINVFANQLIRLSSSSYFKVENLALMLEEETNIRTTLIETLLEVSKDFAVRSIQTKSAQLEATSFDGTENTQLSTIVKWDDSNHLLVFFLSQAPDSICALYRDKEKVPENVQTLLKSQFIAQNLEQWELDDYAKMSAEVLLEKLESIARKTFHKIEYTPYALSADNLVKMALILLRTRANIPVVISGEAGCGKTSLIGFLAEVVGAQFFALNLHAGINEQIITEFMINARNNAKKGEVWIFFDEINTCNHIGLLSDLIAHRIYLGNSIHHNIRLFAACNPYRIRTKSISEAGLQTKKIKKYEEQSNLVYEVKPLPDQILDYVWDYGILQPDDEKKYIQIMVATQLKELNHPALADILSASQQYIRSVEEPYSVSLRDIKRAIILIQFFYESLQNRPPIRKNASKYPPDSHINIRSYILALGLCYQSRLYDQSLRKKYREIMCEIFKTYDVDVDEKEFIKIIRDEQEDYINRMVCPPNTAKNEALLENVLVMTVCILTRIPVFIIGAPGSSKSLAIRLVGQNLRGSDSNDEYFRKLPQVYLIPHQGSSSSTSEGILKVFQKAQNFQETSSNEFPVISVVLLDEVGLAETSPFNPLKVLHSLLEPSYKSSRPSVSVIGISNWRLDNSKSSRALLVQRFDLDDLVDTAARILDNKISDHIQKASLYPLAKAYSIYEQEGQIIPNFHGLRDYYAFIKSLSLNDLTPENIQMSLARNFGGTNKFAEICQKYFDNAINEFNNHRGWIYNPIPTEQLIHLNLDDEGARHLMAIGKSDSVVNLLAYQLRQRNLDPVIIFGSQFPDDQDDYSYSVLNRIMMCVEAGKPLILTDLEIIYGSLYDLWNQNYIVVGSAEDPKYYTRVALGAYANPMLYVNKNFRCILVLDEKNLPKADPPLLNRFEKQKMTINDILSSDELLLVQQLSNWAQNMSTIMSLSEFVPTHKKFTQKDLFIGFDQDETLQSLVIDVRKNNPQLQLDEILVRCKEALITIASSDGIIRAEKSALSRDEVDYWKNVYFNLHNDHIADYFKNLFCDQNPKATADGQQVIINTFSNINADVKVCLQGITTCTVLKLSTFKTEAQFQNRIKHFWFESPSVQTLILQCDVTTVNFGCIKLAKFIIEQFRIDYLNMKQQQQNTHDTITKHVCIILHIHRDRKTSFESFNFMCGWKQVTIESLIPQEKSLSSLLNGDLCDVINTLYSFEDILQQELLWCLLCMKYPSDVKSINHIKTLIAEIPQQPDLVNFLKTKTFEWLQDNSSNDWQYHVASDKKLLYPYSSFSTALQSHIRALVRIPIAKLLCCLERLFLTKTFLNLKWSTSKHSKLLLEFWKQMTNDRDLLNTHELSEPKPDGYLMPNISYDLQFPFSYYFIKQIDTFKKLYGEEIRLLQENPTNIDPNTGKLYDYIFEDYIMGLKNNIMVSIPNLNTSPLEYAPELYLEDFITIISADRSSKKDIPILLFIFKYNLGSEKVLDPILVHAFWWEHSNQIMAEFQLAKLCPSIINETIFENGKTTNMPFGYYLIEGITKMMFQKLNSIKPGTSAAIQFQCWQREVSKVLSLSERLPEASTFASLHLLQVCHNFVSADSISISNMKEIMKAGKGSKGLDIFNQKFIETIFSLMKKLSNNNENSILKLSFINKCLDMVPKNSPSHKDLYQNIFSQKPFHFMSPIIIRVLKCEEKDCVFMTLIKNPNQIFTLSSRLNLINECLKAQGLDSAMSTLCCDIIQKLFFAKLSFQELANNFRDVVDVLSDTNAVALQKICAIAFLKEFAKQFWDYSIQENIMEPIKFEAAKKIGGFDTNALIQEINVSMNLIDPLIYSFKIYFLRELRNKGLSMNEVRRFCEAQQQILPWLGDLPWDSNNETRLPFNPYWSLKDYITVEKSFTTLHSLNNKASFNLFFTSLKKKESADKSLIALIGFIISRLHVIRASRDWTEEEKKIAEFLKEKVDHLSVPSTIYKQTINNIISNNHSLLRINQNVTNSELLVKSVIGHVIALHASIPAESTPLAYMLHNLNNCSDLFIPTCVSDIEALIISAVIQSGQVTRYSCECGYKYVIADCGKAYSIGTCPECKKVIGGHNHISAPGQKKLDSNPITNTIAARDKPGYIMESESPSMLHCLRSLTPVSYRILHLFVHVIIGAWAHTSIAKSFLDKNNQANTNVSTYCMGHITNDWNVLLRILNTSHENLALLLHSILDLMTNSPPKNTSLRKAADRKEWESYFSENYISPLVKSITTTANNFQNQIDTAATNSKDSVNRIEGEINQTLKMDKQHNLEHLPKLWRIICDINFESFRAFYFADLTKHSKSFPFLSVFYKHKQNLELIKYLLPISKFVRILSTTLEYRLSRTQAQQQTFREFIDNESYDDEKNEIYDYLSSTFEEFAKAWNTVIDKVKYYQCHQLPATKPQINLSSPIVFGLVEPKDTGVYLCAILEYLIGLQNNFLQEVAEINPGTCNSLKFLEDGSFSSENKAASSSSNKNTITRYYIQSMRIDQMQATNFIDFQWSDDFLQHSQRNLEIGHGHDIIYNLQKIESELAQLLVFEKVHISTADSQLYIEPFPYHMELFHGHMRIISDIKDLIPQKPISTEKIGLILGSAFSPISSFGYQESLSYDNASELLSHLEILLCFVKKTSVGDGEILIEEYVNQWIKLSNLFTNESFNNLLKIGLKLCHLVSLYEIVEEQVANGIIEYIDDKYKSPLTPELEQEIITSLDFELRQRQFLEFEFEMTKIPAEDFVSALKRFMLRFLSVDSNKDNEPLSLYFGDPSLNLWASWINEEVVDNCFPENLLVKHIFEAFMLVSARIETIKKQLPSATKTVATNSPPITKVVTSKKAPKTISKSTSTLFATRKSTPKISSSNGTRSLEATASKTQLTKTSTSQVQKKDTVKKG
ncbi:601_t:CDS:10, partial [Dentiscutata heterogama]